MQDHAFNTRTEAVDSTPATDFPGGPSNHNNALRTLRRMLGKAEEWNVIKASPKIKLMQEHARERVIDADIEAKLLPFCKQPLRDVLMIMRDFRDAKPEGSFPNAMGASGLGQQTIFRLREQIAQGTEIRANQSACSPGTSGTILGAKGRMDLSFQSRRGRASDNGR